MKHTFIYSLLITILFIQTGCKENVIPIRINEEQPVLFPDYSGVTIPSTIAPLNFTVEDNFSALYVVITGTKQGKVEIQGKEFVDIPEKQWKKLLEENKGEAIQITLSLKQSEGWIEYAPFKIFISEDPIDYSLVYRLVAPGYETYSKMGIYQRNLSNFQQTALVENTLLPGHCVNCHSFRKTQPERMSFHIRGQYSATVLTDGKGSDLYNTRTPQTFAFCVYPYWHPDGKYIAYSINNTQQMFHEVKDERVEVLDHESDIVIYNVETNELFSCPQLRNTDVFETFPSFSADGKTLYFCSANKQAIPAEYNRIQYNLCSIGFNPSDGTFAETVDTLVFAANMDKSVSFPRPSYDGKYLMYTLSDYGNFSIWHRESDLWLMDLETKETRPITEVNSDDVDSYHSWSSNSRWFVFSSRRVDGLYTSPYLAHIDENGNISKPFMLPQKSPFYYRNTFYSFNIPEFVSGPVEMNVREMEGKTISGERIQMKYK